MPIPDEITSQHVLQALDDLDSGVEHSFGPPTGYELVYEGRTYPPKAVVGLAAQYAIGRILHHSEFSGGEAPGQANAFLRDLGFEVRAIRLTGEDWTDDEVRLIVEDYFAMLKAELLGETYSKAEHRSHLRPRLHGRSKGSIEFKHANTSAVMADLGCPYIDGYKPRGNYQALLVEVVESYLEEHPDFWEQLSEGPVLNPIEVVEPGLETTDQVIVPVPTVPEATAPTPTPRGRGRRVDFGQRDAQNRILGEKGEKFVVELERRRLREAGQEDLARKVEWVTKTQGDGLGYDVLSFDEDGSNRYIEVKTTGMGELAPFYVTAGEVACSGELGDRFCLYRVFDLGRQPRVYVLRGPLVEVCRLEPSQYRAWPK